LDFIVELDKVNEKSWNEALENAGINGTIFQSVFWAKYAEEVHGDYPIYLISTDKKGNINGLLLAIQSRYGNYPAFNWGSCPGIRGFVIRKLYKTALRRIFDRTLPFIQWQNGPVVIQHSSLENSSPDKTYGALLEKILNIAEARNFYAIRFARPPYFLDRSQLMSAYGFKKRRMGTILVDLGQSTESLWRSIDRSSRRNIEKTEADFTFAEVRNRADFQDFYNFHVQSTRRLGIEPYPVSHFESLWNFFSSLGKMAVFKAFFRNKPIAASICLLHNGMVHEYTYADSNYARLNRIYAVEPLKWHIIRWAHERSFRYFDLGGAFFFKIDAGDEKARNIYRFKKKWGKIVEFNDYSKTLRARMETKILSLFLTEGEGCHT